MKPAPFKYVRPSAVDEACAALAVDDGARIIAGGQTLVPLMAMRLARPTRLVDIGRIAELDFIRDDGNAVVIGATTRQAAVECSALVSTKLPLLARAIPFVGHAPIRTRGTIGGSLANADPAAEIALVAATLGATMLWRGERQAGEIVATEFVLGPMFTALPSATCLTAVRFPVWPEGQVGTGFQEVSARRSDFAFVSAAAQLALDADRRCTRAAVGIGAATAAPLRLTAVENALIGARVDPTLLRDAVESMLSEVETMEDLHASAAYRRRVAIELTIRAITDAYADAKIRGDHAR